MGDEASPKQPAPTSKAIWAVVYQIRDDVSATRADGHATRRHLEGWTDTNGVFHEGLLTRHTRLREDFDAMKAAKAQGGERRWLVQAGVIGAALTKFVDFAFTYLTAKGGNHP